MGFQWFVDIQWGVFLTSASSENRVRVAWTMICTVKLPGLVLDAFVYSKRSPMRTYAKRTTGWESVLGDENDFPVKGIRRFFKWMSDIHSDPIAWLQSQYDNLIS